MKVKKSRLISSKRGVVVKGQWKAVNVDPSVFCDEGLDGLVCFEELTDYSLVEPEKAMTAQEHAQTTSRGRKKRKAEEKPARKKKKRQKKSNPEEEPQDVPDETLEAEDEISPDQCPDVTPETQHKTSKKKKKQQQRKKKKTDEAGAQSRKKSKNWSRPALVGSEGPSADVSAWKDLFVPEPVLKALSVLGFSAPTPIQALALPPAVRDRLDIVGAAETVPEISVVDLLTCRCAGVKTAIVVGGMAPQKQHRVLMHRPEIVIGTPGRLWEMIREKHPHLQNLRQLRCLVIDEADRMVEKGHFAELENLLEMLNTSQFNPSRQTFVFSATLTLEHSLPARLQQKKRKRTERSRLQLLMEKVGIKDKPKVIDLTRKQATVETLTETRINCTKEEKDLFLYYFLLQYPGRSMVFANSIDCIKRLSALLLILDCAPLPLHANMHQKQRLKNLERFAEKDSCVLLTTDVAARGLDIPNVQHVIHYQVPRTSETYVHRSGRTARAAREGLSLLLIGPDDLMNYKKICRTLQKSEELPVFPVQSHCMSAIKERVTLARKIEKMEYFHSREKQHNSWVRQASEALEIDVDDDLLLGGGEDEDEEREQQRLIRSLKKQLKQLIAQPVFTHQMKTKYPTQMGKLQLPLSTANTALSSLSRDTLPR
ncbi:ATP-dependent RNA helicase DDX24 [Sinocyclocheilus rhinocerous]|uniref:ATP-dependent RNA helicase DDX24 n=1 Tax=Sinocyclocheilus rhinocerous TaxID=307959 RepID=UPI0007B87E86|nr:PREDICTED: ATP-dependent RNA helicase DDX24 [Sinocyclocheilus rhinocerous]